MFVIPLSYIYKHVIYSVSKAYFKYGRSVNISAVKKHSLLHFLGFQYRQDQIQGPACDCMPFFSI